MIPEKFKYQVFGRLKSRKKKHFINQLDLNQYNENIKLDINKEKFNILDVGSGSGESSIYLSNRHINVKIFTCDLFEDGNINLYNNIKKDKIKNIHIFQRNVLEFLDNLGSFLIFEEVWILFPDPWPKTKHHKRRLINNEFLKKIHYYIKDNGKLIIASDSESYIQSIVKNIYDLQSLFLWQNQRVDNWTYRILDLPRTKFYKKALKSNRNSMFFSLLKI